MNRRVFIKTAGAAACGLSLARSGLARAAARLPFSSDVETPNIIVILADDLGFGDAGCYGAKALATPGIDRIAREGVRFTNGYAASATCTPSRYALLTGEYPWRKKEARILSGEAPLLIRPGTETLPAILKQAGYRTAVVGKWHLGLGGGEVDWNRPIAPGPNEIGFDYSFIMPATNDRVPTVYCENGRVLGLVPSDPLRVSYQRNFEGEPTGRDHPELLKMRSSRGHDQSIHNGIGRIGYQKGGTAARWTDETMAGAFFSRAEAFIRGNGGTPFFLYYALHQPHVPRVPNPEFAGSTSLGPRGDAIAEADACVSGILSLLDELKIAEETIVVFSSDNGPVLDDGYVDRAVETNGEHRPAGPLRGGKYSLFDAGTHVPFLVRWPGRVRPGTSDALVCQMDLLASMAALTGRRAGVRDSRNLLPALLGRSPEGRADLVLEASGKLAYREGDWVLIPPSPGPEIYDGVEIESGCAPAARLFNLRSDPGQMTDRAVEEPARLDRMMKKLAEIR